MLTARAEYRLWLRADNALTRVGPIARDANLLSEGRLQAVEAYACQKHEASRRLSDSCAATDLGVGDGAA